MKKTLKRVLSVVLCMLIAMTAVGICTASAEEYTYTGTVIYLSDNGNDKNDGKTAENAVKTIAKAATLAGKDGTVVVTDAYTYDESLPACTIAGLNSDSVINLKSWRLDLGGNVTFKNINLKVFVNWSYILCNGYKLVIDENVTTQRNTGINKNLGIRGGGDKKAINGNTEIVIKSGEWNAVSVGTRLQSVNGNGHVTIYDTASVNSFTFGSEEATTEFPFVGASTIKLVGGMANVGKVLEIVDNVGKCYVDVTEFTGKLADSWNDLGVVVLEKASDVPDEAKPGGKLTDENKKKAEKGLFFSGENLSEKPAVDYSGFFAIPEATYDLSGIDNIVYISDAGNDNNDGKTKDTPVKSFYVAENVLGPEGGTIVVTGTYTYDGTYFSYPVNITSTCSKDVFVMKSWALRTNNTTIENLNILIAADWGYILHRGTPLVIGKNVNFAFGTGINRYLSIRAEEGGTYAATDITINSGKFKTIMTGTKNGNIKGDANITINGGTVDSVDFGGDGDNCTVMGNATVKITGKASVGSVTSKNNTEGTMTLDLSEYQGADIPVANGIVVIKGGNEIDVPLKTDAVFIDGYPNNTFLPDKKMTRAEAIKVVSVICGYTGSGSKDSKFTDVPSTEWYAGNVKYLETLGVLSFYSGKLEPGKEITRGEFVKLISALIKEQPGTASFPDVSKTHLYYKEIIKAANAGIVEGNPDGTFAPDTTLTRAQIVTMLDRLLERNIIESNAVKVEKFSDIDGHWAEKYIIAASCGETLNGVIIWYAGGVYAGNSPVDTSKLEFDTTTEILKGIDKTDAAAVEKSIDTYTEKRIEEIRNTTSIIEPASGKKAYYVSNSGNDSNDGTSPEKAWKTLDKVSSATLKSGDVVYFNRGDIFRGQLVTKFGVKYSAYGEGEKPKLYGSLRNYSEDKSFWEPTATKNVYVSSETFDLDVGLIVFNEGEAWTIKKAAGINGTAVLKDLEMYHNTSDKKIYLYSTSDPNFRFDSTEICVQKHIITGNGSSVTIDNLCIMYTGAHGIGYSGNSNLTIQNCELGWIGGSLQRTGDDPVRYGNAIELYDQGSKFTVENCYIYQVYDAAVTHQYFGADTNSTRDFSDIKYIDNVITHSTYAIEYKNDSPDGVMQDIEFSGNIFAHSGDGWGNQRPPRNGSLTAVIKGWGGGDANHAENFVIYDNVIMTKNDEAALVHMAIGDAADMPEITGNVFFAKYGNYFGLYGLEYDIEKNMLKCNDKLLDKTIGLDDNTFVFAK